MDVWRRVKIKEEADHLKRPQTFKKNKMTYFLTATIIVMFLIIQVQIMQLKKAKGIMLEWENLSERTKKLLKGESPKKSDIQEMISEVLNKRMPYTRNVSYLESVIRETLDKISHNTNK